MLLQNFTGSKLRENTISVFYCSRELIREVHNHFIFLAVLNTLVSATAFLGNTLAIIALYKESSLNPASKLLYCNLAITDLCVGLIVQPLKVICCLSAVIEQGNLCRYILKTSVIMAYILSGVSLTNTCNWCRQDSRFATTAEIQGSCNLKKKHLLPYLWFGSGLLYLPLKRRTTILSHLLKLFRVELYLYHCV